MSIDHRPVCAAITRSLLENCVTIKELKKSHTWTATMFAHEISRTVPFLSFKHS